MKPELVSEERLEELWAIRLEQHARGCVASKKGEFFVGAHAALEDLRVVRIEEIDLRYYKGCLDQRPLILGEELVKGAVLVRVKEKP